jgi:O-antigen/teichoic acid export membrane protein
LTSRLEACMPAQYRAVRERLAQSPLAHRFASGAFWATLGAVLSQSFGLISSIIAARVLGREQFGQYGVVLATVGMFSVFAGFGLGATATKYVAELKYADPDRAGRIIALSSVIAVATGVLASAALLVFAPYLSARTLASPQLAGMIRLATGMILLGALNSAQMGALAGFEVFQKIARLNLYAGMISFAAVTCGILTLGLAGALAGQVLALGLSCLLNRIALRGEARRFGVPLRYAGCGREKSVLIRFSLPAVLSGIMVSPVNWACSALLVNQPNGYAEMGIYNAAASWQRAILFLPGCLGAIALPMLAELHGSKQRDKYKKALWLNVLLNGGAALLVFPVISLFSKAIMRSYGPAFEPGYTVLILLGLSAVFFSVGSVIGNAIASAGNMWFGFLFNAMWGAAYVAAAWFLVPQYGALGLALANAIAYFLHTLWQLPYLRKI